jgi:hypothetical protein
MLGFAPLGALPLSDAGGASGGSGDVTLTGAAYPVAIAFAGGERSYGQTLSGGAYPVCVSFTPGARVAGAILPGASFPVAVALTGGARGIGATLAGTAYPVSVSLAGGGRYASGTILPGASFPVVLDFTPGGRVAGAVMPGAAFPAALSFEGGGLSLTLLGAALPALVELATGGRGVGSSIVLARATIRLRSSPLSWREIPVYTTKYEDWFVIKGTARRAVHDVFAVAAIHTPSEPNGVQKACRVRWHIRGQRLLGDLQGQGYGEVISDADRLVFNTEQLATAGITLKRGDRLTIPALNNSTFVLSVLDPTDGPITQTWEVERA